MSVNRKAHKLHYSTQVLKVTWTLHTTWTPLYMLFQSVLAMYSLLTYLGQGIPPLTQTVPLFVIGGVGLGMH